MQIKEFEALTLKECLQQVRDDMGPEAVILETRKARKGGVLGMGRHEAVCIVAATGITVQGDLPKPAPQRDSEEDRPRTKPAPEKKPHGEGRPPGNAAAAAARQAYGNTASPAPNSAPKKSTAPPVRDNARTGTEPARDSARNNGEPLRENAHSSAEPAREALRNHAVVMPQREAVAAGFASLHTQEIERFASLERAMQEIREGMNLLRQQQEAHERKFSAVVSAIVPNAEREEDFPEASDYQPRFPELHRRLLDSGITPALAEELLDSLPNLETWSIGAQGPMAESALRELMCRRVPCAGPIQLTPGQLKAVAMIGPTGVGKTTTIAKLAAHFSLVEGKKVGLLTVDTYRIAAVEQLKTYSQIIDIPIAVAYNQAEVLPAVEQFRDFDLLLIDTAGRSQKNIMQVGELKALLESVRCETHLVLSALIKEQDMLDAANRFSGARVDRILFSKLDETSTYGTLFNVADQTGIPISYLTTGQKVPEDIETADGRRLAELILNTD